MELTAKVAGFSSEVREKTVKTITTENDVIGKPVVSKETVSQEYNVDIKEIPYQEMVKGYTMPFEYLWSWLITCKDKDFVLELSNLVYNSEFVITVYDDYIQNVSTTVDKKSEENTTDLDGSKYYKIYDSKTSTVYIGEPNPVVNRTESYRKNVDTTETNVTTNTYDNVTYSLSKVNSWLVEMIQSVTYKDNGTTGPDLIDSVKHEDEIDDPVVIKDWKNGDSKFIERLNNDVDRIIENQKKVIEDKKINKGELAIDKGMNSYLETRNHKIYNQITEIYDESTSRKYNLLQKEARAKVENNPDEENFVTIYNKDAYRNVRIIIKDNGLDEWLFDCLEQNEETVDMIDVTKFLLFKATGKSYGIEELDLSYYKMNNTSGEYVGNSIEEKVWWALRDAGYSEIATAGVMGNIYAESGFDPNAIEAGNGIGLGLCQWSYGRRDQLEAFATSRGIEPGDIDLQIEFLLAEVTPGGGADGFADYQLMNNKGYSPEDWINATDIDVSTTAFMWTFERPGIPHLDRRIEQAKVYFDMFKGVERPSFLGSTIEVANGTKSEKIEYLFPNGLPTSDSEMQQYLETIEVPMTKKDGTKYMGKLTVHKAVAKDVKDIFKQAQDSGFKIYEAVGYVFRKIADSSNLSQHSYGIAIDINVKENYCVNTSGKVYAGEFWNPSKSEYSIPTDGIVVKAFKAKGWGWRWRLVQQKRLYAFFFYRILVNKINKYIKEVDHTGKKLRKE